MKKFLTIIIIFLFSVCCVSYANSSLIDLEGLTDGQIQSIENVYYNDLMSDYGDGTFRPYNGFTRAEFARLIILVTGHAAEVESVTTTTFTDVSNIHWAYGYIELAAQYDLIPIYGNEFLPQDPVLIQQVIYGLINGLDLGDIAEEQGGYPDGYISLANEIELGNNLDSSVYADSDARRVDVAVLVDNTYTYYNAMMNPFDDIYDLTQEQQTAILALNMAQIMKGYTDRTFRPLQVVTREEYAQTIVKATKLEYLTDAFANAAPFTFIDVPQNRWSYGYIQLVAACDFIPISGDKFEPEKPVLLSEVIYGLINILGYNYEFSDNESAYPLQYTLKAVELGITDNIYSRINTTNNATRVDLAVMIMNSFNIPEYRIPGDINDDRNINIIDVKLLLQKVVNGDAVTSEDLIVCDLNNDSRINIIDVKILLQRVINNN